MHRNHENRDPVASGERRYSVKPPHASLFALEPMRAAVELLASVGVGPLLRYLPRGDGHPVLVLPAFGASDAATRRLRRRLRSMGYFLYGSKAGRMTGEPGTLDRIAARLLEITAKHGAPVSIIGWSLGGMYARELARSHRASVRNCRRTFTAIVAHDVRLPQQSVTSRLLVPGWSIRATRVTGGTPHSSTPPTDAVRLQRPPRALHAAFTLMGPEFMRAEPSWQPRPAQ